LIIALVFEKNANFFAENCDHNIDPRFSTYPIKISFLFGLVGQTQFKRLPGAGERTRDLLIAFIFSFHHFTAEPQRLPRDSVLGYYKVFDFAPRGEI
jgi:hypothetical protein